jgi:hypothetical protein
MATARVEVLNKVPHKGADGWVLYLQWCRYIYNDGKRELGYRFIWCDPDGHLHPTRGQACISSLKIVKKLVDKAKQEGWGDEVGGYI